MNEKSLSRDEQLVRLLALLRQHRWGALATTGKEGQPEASMAAYAFSGDMDEVYLHLSQLAAHTRNLQHQPRASLVICECDTGDGDPQQLARAILFGTVSVIDHSDADYAQARKTYLSRLPDAEQRFSFSDFALFRFHLEKIRFVGGFAQAYSFRAEELSEH